MPSIFFFPVTEKPIYNRDAGKKSWKNGRAKTFFDAFAALKEISLTNSKKKARRPSTEVFHYYKRKWHKVSHFLTLKICSLCSWWQGDYSVAWWLFRFWNLLLFSTGRKTEVFVEHNIILMFRTGPGLSVWGECSCSLVFEGFWLFWTEQDKNLIFSLPYVCTLAITYESLDISLFSLTFYLTCETFTRKKVHLWDTH